jgi:hypothetical protein
MTGTLSSVVHDPGTIADPFDVAFFVIEDSSQFRFSAFRENTFSFEPLDTLHSEERVILTQFEVPGNLGPDDLAARMVARASIQGTNPPELRLISMEKINGYGAFEGEMYQFTDRTTMVVYICILVHEGKAVAIQGLSPNRFKEYSGAFGRFARSIRFR